MANIIQVGQGAAFFRYDPSKKLFQVAKADGLQDTIPNELVRWSHSGAATYDFTTGVAVGVDIAKLKGNANLIALLNAVIADLSN